MESDYLNYQLQQFKNYSDKYCCLNSFEFYKIEKTFF